MAKKKKQSTASPPRDGTIELQPVSREEFEKEYPSHVTPEEQKAPETIEAPNLSAGIPNMSLDKQHEIAHKASQGVWGETPMPLRVQPAPEPQTQEIDLGEGLKVTVLVTDSKEEVERKVKEAINAPIKPITPFPIVAPVPVHTPITSAPLTGELAGNAYETEFTGTNSDEILKLCGGYHMKIIGDITIIYVNKINFSVKVGDIIRKNKDGTISITTTNHMVVS